MKRLITCILTMSVVLATFANDNQVARINAIKKNSNYIYGDATMPTLADAVSFAYETLQEEIQEWAQRDSITIKVKSAIEINSLADTIMTRRADMYRVFAYVKKSDLIQSADTIKTEPQPTIKDEPHANIDKQPVSKPKKPSKSKDSMVNDSIKQVLKHRFGGKKHYQSDALLRIKEAKNFFELKEIMLPLKEKGDIIDYGKYATIKHPEQCYLIVYDPAGNIRALLDKGGEIRKNLKTGNDDSISNYRGCGAIWFTLPEKNDDNNKK